MCSSFLPVATQIILSVTQHFPNIAFALKYMEYENYSNTSKDLAAISTGYIYLFKAKDILLISCTHNLHVHVFQNFLVLKPSCACKFASKPV